ncbi:hypothetical protein CAPTEDRAFT_200245 [Capitella teleta]|uniref:HTH CENPB-type domain-containing protein n=1 Tax=Capitella teleta TaxID=283909 RepID=R7UWV0_CAPTE|nr:hypothetical protein CAPTEDRAFT_200245 [Capitella teleta]|eukprot:ELU10804.1 hypothetical protein CAPTEDRAFT_200245 [Capitella teleta]
MPKLASFGWKQDKSGSNVRWQSFKASREWLNRFKIRHKISLHQATHISQMPKKEINVRVNGFLGLAIRARSLRQYCLQDISNMDETLTWFKMPGNSTTDFEYGECDCDSQWTTEKELHNNSQMFQWC